MKETQSGFILVMVTKIITEKEFQDPMGGRLQTHSYDETLSERIVLDNDLVRVLMDAGPNDICLKRYLVGLIQEQHHQDGVECFIVHLYSSAEGRRATIDSTTEGLDWNEKLDYHTLEKCQGLYTTLKYYTPDSGSEILRFGSDL